MKAFNGDSGNPAELLHCEPGIVRNFLLPRKLAVEATASNLNTMKQQEAARKHKAETEKAAALEDAARLSGKSIRISVKSGTGSRLFGAVTSKEIAETIKTQCGVDVPKNIIFIC